MSLTIHPDPQEPAGGFGFLELPAGSLPDGGVTVSVMERFGDRWLAPTEAEGAPIEIGNPHWQADPHDFGPYAVYRHDGADWVRIGPEIVNKIEEYTALKIVVAGKPFDVTWPDDLRPRAGAAVLGGIQTIVPNPRKVDSRLVGKAAPPAPAPPVPPETPRVVAAPAPAPIAEPGRTDAPPRRWLLPLGLLALVLVAGTAWWLWSRDRSEPVAKTPIVPEIVAPPPQVAADPDACTREALTALAGFAAIEAAIRSCGGAVATDTAFDLIDEFARQSDPAALLLLGTLYDEQAQDPVIKSGIGLALEADAAKAADYYARALKAGSGTAESRLASTCARLATSSSTLDKGAFDDFCR